MKTFIAIVFSFFLLLSTAPAGAVPIPACAPGDFQLIAKTKVGTENGPVKIDGGILVTDDDGSVFVGAKNKIKQVVAHKIFLGTGAVVDNCIADVVTGPGSCTTVSGTFAAAPAGCKSIPFDPQIVDLCVNTALAVNVPADTTESLAPGCYGFVRVGQNATLNLQSGLYFIRNLRTLNNATIQGVPGTKVRVKEGGTTISAASHLLDLDFFNAGTIGSLQIGNATELTNSVLVALFSGIHLHTGVQMDGATVAAESIVVEPITTKSGDSNPFCTCPIGFHLPGLNICIPD